MTAGVREDYAKEAGVFRFDAEYGLEVDDAKKVSDHYPVYAVWGGEVAGKRCETDVVLLNLGD